MVVLTVKSMLMHYALCNCLTIILIFLKIITTNYDVCDDYWWTPEWTQMWEAVFTVYLQSRDRGRELVNLGRLNR